MFCLFITLTKVMLFCKSQAKSKKKLAVRGDFFLFTGFRKKTGYTLAALPVLPERVERAERAPFAGRLHQLLRAVQREHLFGNRFADAFFQYPEDGMPDKIFPGNQRDLPRGAGDGERAHQLFLLFA